MTTSRIKLYKAVVEGKNCILEIDGRERQLGFFTTRVVHGREPSDAKMVMLSEIQDELKSQLLNASDNPPELMIIEIDEIDSTMAQSIANAGFTWYQEDATEN